MYYADLVVGPTLNNVPQLPGSWAAVETFDMITNFDQRKNMLLVAAKRRRFDGAIVDEFDKLLSKLKKSGDPRIHAAHGRWSIDDSIADGLVWQKRFGGFSSSDPNDGAQIYRVRDFAVALHNIGIASGRLFEFFRRAIHPRLEREAKFLVTQILETVTPEQIV